jgi:ABC-type branched-subunit amino acid transport system ATPase component
MTDELVLELAGVSRQFGAVRALTDVSFDCRAGEVHALVGENGSGKSTLLGIASGFVDPDPGTVRIGGKPLRGLAGAGAQARAGDGLPGHLAGAAEPVKNNLYWRRPRPAPALPAAQEVGPEGARRVRPRHRAVPRRPGRASPGRAAALRGRQGTGLQPEGAAARRADDRARPGRGRGAAPDRRKRAGSAASAWSTSVTASPRSSRSPTGSRCSAMGATSGHLRRPEGPPRAELVELIVGRPFEAAFPPPAPRREPRRARRRRSAGSVVRPGQLHLESGETVVGIAGAEGNGQPQLFDCLAGRTPPEGGRVVCDGKELTLISTHEAVGAGIMLLPGDRKHEALMGVLGVRVNSTIQSLRSFSVRVSSAWRAERGR